MKTSTLERNKLKNIQHSINKKFTSKHWVKGITLKLAVNKVSKSALWQCLSHTIKS